MEHHKSFSDGGTGDLPGLKPHWASPGAGPSTTGHAHQKRALGTPTRRRTPSEDPIALDHRRDKRRSIVTNRQPLTSSHFRFRVSRNQEVLKTGSYWDWNQEVKMGIRFKVIGNCGCKRNRQYISRKVNPVKFLHRAPSVLPPPGADVSGPEMQRARAGIKGQEAHFRNDGPLAELWYQSERESLDMAEILALSWVKCGPGVGSGQRKPCCFHGNGGGGRAGASISRDSMELTEMAVKSSLEEGPVPDSSQSGLNKEVLMVICSSLAVLDGHNQDDVGGYSTQAHNMEHEVPNHDRIFTYERNDSWSVPGKTCEATGSGPRQQVQQMPLRSYEGNEELQVRRDEGPAQAERPSATSAVPAGGAAGECTRCGNASENQPGPWPRHRSQPCEECGRPCGCVSCLYPRKTVIVEGPNVRRSAGKECAGKECDGKVRDGSEPTPSQSKAPGRQRPERASAGRPAAKRLRRGGAGEKSHACDVCGKAFRFDSYLQRHRRTHTGEKPYHCEACGKAFRSHSYFREHLRTHAGDARHECPRCGKAFGCLSSFRDHARTHTGERPYACPRCGKTFGCYSSLREHGRSHGAQKPYACPECGKAFRYPSSLRTHARTHDGGEARRCERCGKTFSCRVYFRRHLRTHSGERPYTCAHCGRAYGFFASLCIHVRTHTGERPFACAQCGKSFGCQSSLREHVRTHSGEKPLLCELCGKAFSHPQYFQKHLKSHREGKRFECGRCGKAYRCASSLRVHGRTHTGERPYECPRCGKPFRCRASLRGHVKTHAGEGV